MAGVICPAIIGTDDVGVGRTWPSQGNGAPGGRVEYRERAIVSSSAIYLWRVYDEESRGLALNDGEVFGECMSVLASRRCAES
jgi:hypothetical protein